MCRTQYLFIEWNIEKIYSKLEREFTFAIYSHVFSSCTVTTIKNFIQMKPKLEKKNTKWCYLVFGIKIDKLKECGSFARETLNTHTHARTSTKQLIREYTIYERFNAREKISSAGAWLIASAGLFFFSFLLRHFGRSRDSSYAPGHCLRVCLCVCVCLLCMWMLKALLQLSQWNNTTNCQNCVSCVRCAVANQFAVAVALTFALRVCGEFEIFEICMNRLFIMG